jgi:cysteinyl-tRNA synthetase
LKAAQAGLLGFQQFYMLLGDVAFSPSDVSESYVAEFTEAVSDDLNMPKALAVASKLRRDPELSPASKKATLLNFDAVLGLELETLDGIVFPPEVKTMIADRDAAREAKDWETSDARSASLVSQSLASTSTTQPTEQWLLQNSNAKCPQASLAGIFLI